MQSCLISRRVSACVGRLGGSWVTVWLFTVLSSNSGHPYSCLHADSISHYPSVTIPPSAWYELSQKCWRGQKMSHSAPPLYMLRAVSSAKSALMGCLRPPPSVGYVVLNFLPSPPPWGTHHCWFLMTCKSLTINKRGLEIFTLRNS